MPAFACRTPEVRPGAARSLSPGRTVKDFAQAAVIPSGQPVPALHVSETHGSQQETDATQGLLAQRLAYAAPLCLVGRRADACARRHAAARRYRARLAGTDGGHGRFPGARRSRIALPVRVRRQPALHRLSPRLPAHADAARPDRRTGYPGARSAARPRRALGPGREDDAVHRQVAHLPARRRDPGVQEPPPRRRRLRDRRVRRIGVARAGGASHLRDAPRPDDGARQPVLARAGADARAAGRRRVGHLRGAAAARPRRLPAHQPRARLRCRRRAAARDGEAAAGADVAGRTARTCGERQVRGGADRPRPRPREQRRRRARAPAAGRGARAVRASGADGPPVREHRHRAVPGRTHGIAPRAASQPAAAPCRSRAVAGEGVGRQCAVVPRAGRRSGRRRAAQARSRPVRRRAQRRILAALPADHAQPVGRGGRRRGADPLAPSAARPRAAGDLHSARRIHRPDQLSRQLGAQGRVHAARRMGPPGASAAVRGGQRVAAAVPRPALHAERARGDRADGHRPAAHRARDHREPADARPRAGQGPARGADRTGHPLRDRRFRHRLLEPRVPATLPAREAEDRPQLRREPADLAQRPRDRIGRGRPRADARSGARRRRRRDRGAARAADRDGLQPYPGLARVPGVPSEELARRFEAQQLRLHAA